jgi:hypothetical protein
MINLSVAFPMSTIVMQGCHPSRHRLSLCQRLLGNTPDIMKHTSKVRVQDKHGHSGQWDPPVASPEKSNCSSDYIIGNGDKGDQEGLSGCTKLLTIDR